MHTRSPSEKRSSVRARGALCSAVERAASQLCCAGSTNAARSATPRATPAAPRAPAPPTSPTIQRQGNKVRGAAVGGVRDDARAGSARGAERKQQYIHTGETSAPRRGLAASFRAAAPVGPPGHDLALEVEASGHTHRPWKARQAVASARARRPGVARGHTGTYLTGEVCHGAQMRHTLGWQLSEEPPPTPQSPSTSGRRSPYLPILIQMLIGI